MSGMLTAEERRVLTCYTSSARVAVTKLADSDAAREKRIADLEAQVRELEADRERLDWWLAHSGCAICSGGKTYAVYGVYSDRITGWHDTPRGALDEALRKEKA